MYVNIVISNIFNLNNHFFFLFFFSSGVITNISDHYPVFAGDKFPTLPKCSISINYRVFSDENLSSFKNSLQDVNWHRVLINDDADEAYDLQYSKVPY